MTKPSPAKRPTRKPSPPPLANAGDPSFGEPQPSPDPAAFRVPHGSDTQKYHNLSKLLQQIPLPRGGAIEPVLTLEQVYGSAGATKVRAIQSAGQIVFHSVGDTGGVRGPNTQSLVADKMVTDFAEQNPADIPSFFFHLGDVVYSFGEAQYYYDQFYEPYREYQAPIVAIPGNHDGMVYTGDPSPTLDAYLRNFCAAMPTRTPEAGGLQRTSMIAPSVYFTFDAPFVRILGLYSNVLEDPGVISSEGNATSAVDDRQLAFLAAALKRAKQEKFAGAVIVAVHHPPFTAGSQHGGSPRMLQDLDQASQQAGFWPHAYFAAHSHNYQRYTRTVGNIGIPYLVAGGGGHNIVPLQKSGSGGIRTPFVVNKTLTLENYDDTAYSYLRIVVDGVNLRIENHPAPDGAGAKTPNDAITVNLKTRAIS
jgi:Calcineurin-like phosphoesterase